MPEVLLTSGLTGVIWAVFAGQPLVIVGVPAPVVIFTTCTYQLAQGLHIGFLEFHCWICIFSALMHWALAICGSCTAVKRVTRFAGESFGFFIAFIFLRFRVV